MTKHCKNKWWRAAEFHLVNVFKVPEFTVSKIRGFKFRNSYQVLPYINSDLYLFSQNEINSLLY